MSPLFRYTAEINIPDSISLYSQLGAGVPKEVRGLELAFIVITGSLQSWVMPTDDCHQLFDWDTGHINPNLVPHHTRRV